MRKGKKYALVAAAAAAVAIITGGLVQASFTDAKDLRTLLVPTAEHPAAHLIDSEVTLKEVGQSALPIPWGMVWSPTACQDYLEQNVPNLYQSEGWTRSTDRSAASFSHDNFYMDLVAHIPGGVDLNKVRQSALSCKNGTLTLDGKVTGTVNYTEIAAPAVSGSSTVAFKVDVIFPATKDAETAAIMAKYGYGDGDGAAVIANKEIIVVVNGETLFTVMSPDSSIAQQIATTFGQKVLAAK